MNETNWKVDTSKLRKENNIQSEDFTFEYFKYFFNIEILENQKKILFRIHYSAIRKQCYATALVSIKNKEENKNYNFELYFPVRTDGQSKIQIPLEASELIDANNGWVFDDNSICFSILFKIDPNNFIDQSFKTINRNIHQYTIEAIYRISSFQNNIKERISSEFKFGENNQNNFHFGGKSNPEKKIQIDLTFTNITQSQKFTVYVLLQNSEINKSKSLYETITFDSSNNSHPFIFDVNESDFNESNGWVFRQTVQFQFKIGNFEFTDFPEKVDFVSQNINDHEVFHQQHRSDLIGQNMNLFLNHFNSNNDSLFNINNDNRANIKDNSFLHLFPNESDSTDDEVPSKQIDQLQKDTIEEQKNEIDILNKNNEISFSQKKNKDLHGFNKHSSISSNIDEDSDINNNDLDKNINQLEDISNPINSNLNLSNNDNFDSLINKDFFNHRHNNTHLLSNDFYNRHRHICGDNGRFNRNSNFINDRLMRGGSSMNEEISKLIESNNREEKLKNQNQNQNNNISHTNNIENDIGLAGLQNQGATCYLNSAIQLLFHIPAFRRIIYQINIADDKIGNTKDDRIALNLQKLFIEMQINTHGVCSTSNLTKSFGWSQNDLITEQDIQEFIRSLIDNLETKIKGTEIDGNIAKIFRGTSCTIIRAPQVQFENKKIEYFYDLPLDVRGSATLEESIKNYLKTEKLTGNNMYHVDGLGPQEAEMHTEFLEYPSVLQIHLKRFEYDFQKRMQCKINDRFEFPPSLDLSPFLTTNEDQEKKPEIYDLYCILVHEGFAQIGHYYAFIRHILDVDDKGNAKYNDDLNDWFKFNDSFVTKSSFEEAVTNNYGGTYNFVDSKMTMMQSDKYFSAYMLVYVKRDRIMDLMKPVTEKDIPQHLQEYIKELKEREKSVNTFDEIGFHYNSIRNENRHFSDNDENEEEKIIEVPLMMEESFFANFTKDICELCLKEKKTIAKIPSKAKIEEIYRIAEEALNVEKDTIRLWETTGESKPFKPFYRFVFHDFPKNFFVQKKEKNDPLKISKPYSITAFVIFFDISLEVPAQYLGSTRIKKNDPISSVFKFTSNLLGFPENTEYFTLKELGGQYPFTEVENNYLLKEKGVIIVLQLKNHELISTSNYRWKTKEDFVEALEKDELREEEIKKIPFYNLLEKSRDNLTNAKHYFHATRRYIYIVIHNIKKQEKPLIRVKYSTAFKISDLTDFVVKTLNLQIDKENDSLLLFNTYDDSIRINNNYMTSFKDVSIKKEYKFFYQEIKGMNFETIQKSKNIRTFILADGYNVSLQTKVYSEIGAEAPSLVSFLITDGTLDDSIFPKDENEEEEENDGIDDDFFKAFRWMEEGKVRVLQVENHVISKVFNTEDPVSSNTYEIHIVIIPKEQRKLSKNQFLAFASHIHSFKGTKHYCLNPFMFVIDKEERVWELEDRLKKTIKMEDNWNDCVLYLGNNELKVPAMKVQYLIANNKSNLIIYHKNQQKR